MCTAVSFKVKDHYFGRNLDFEYTFGEKITITPRKYRFLFKNGTFLDEHFAVIGMALTVDNYPLYFDATNEMGLSVAGLNFPYNAYYTQDVCDKINIASFEFIPYVLSQCKSVDEAKTVIEKINITDAKFNNELVPTPLHWMISDKDKSITVEQTKDGLCVYNNSVGVLTNNPTFDMQMFNLNNYLTVTSNEPDNLFSQNINLDVYSRGLGGLGLPGDFSSQSRFVKATFAKLNSVCSDDESEAISQFFHILNSVAQIRGCVKVSDSYEITNYSSCCNTDKCIYYYTTYNNPAVSAVDMYKENLDDFELKVFDLKSEFSISMQN